MSGDHLQSTWVTRQKMLRHAQELADNLINEYGTYAAYEFVGLIASNVTEKYLEAKKQIDALFDQAEAESKK